MAVFGNYSKYYDLLYREKDYSAEAAYVSTLLRAHGAAPACPLLEIGCGTGKHALEFAKAGHPVAGLDRSPAMLEEGRARTRGVPGIRFLPGDAKDFNLGETFDAAVSLFHVMSYLTGNADLAGAFRSVSRHLKPRGLFLFDFWYGPGVLSDPPAPREKSAEDDRYLVKRKARPTVDSLTDTVRVEYLLTAVDKDTGATDEIKETHLMRYLFAPELEILLSQAGMSLLTVKEWMSLDEAPKTSSWNACAVARKKG
jgi:SAM-dependent methyltransferase